MLDKAQQPLIGATIANLIQNKGTISDVEGQFTLLAAVGDQLSISYTGYIPQQFTVSEQDDYTFVLAEGHSVINHH